MKKIYDAKYTTDYIEIEYIEDEPPIYVGVSEQRVALGEVSQVGLTLGQTLQLVDELLKAVERKL
jgi:hypothetical protein